MPKRRNWTRDERLVAFRLYCHTPFGRLHQHNTEIILLSGLISRTPSAIAMKACNFASLDPLQRDRKISGLRNISQADLRLWEEFKSNPEYIAAEAEEVYAGLAKVGKPDEKNIELPTGETEIERTVRSRRVQKFFRSAVLASYEFRCALSGLEIPELLNASHIIPWSEDKKRRADPSNGIALNTLYDRAFDRGLFTFDENFRVVISPILHTPTPVEFHRATLLQIHGHHLTLPKRFHPDPEALAYHRNHIFRPA